MINYLESNQQTIDNQAENLVANPESLTSQVENSQAELIEAAHSSNLDSKTSESIAQHASSEINSIHEAVHGHHEHHLKPGEIDKSQATNAGLTGLAMLPGIGDFAIAAKMIKQGYESIKIGKKGQAAMQIFEGVSALVGAMGSFEVIKRITENIKEMKEDEKKKFESDAVDEIDKTLDELKNQGKPEILIKFQKVFANIEPKHLAVATAEVTHVILGVATLGKSYIITSALKKIGNYSIKFDHLNHEAEHSGLKDIIGSKINQLSGANELDEKRKARRAYYAEPSSAETKFDEDNLVY